MRNRSGTLKDEAEDAFPSWLCFLMASACGLIVANIYYAQPLVGPISQSLDISPSFAGLIVTMSQIGYGIGLLFIVPLSDLRENRRLILLVIALASIGLALAGSSTSGILFLFAALCIGLGSVAVQIIVPFAAHLAPPGEHGKAVGNVLSGLMLGIMLARPVASLITYLSSWRMVFLFSVIVMLSLGITLRHHLPRRKPRHQLNYRQLLSSMTHLAKNQEVLRRRGIYQACLFGGFSLFWTVVPLELADTFKLSQAEIALFALAGVAGAISAPLGGRMADKKLEKHGTFLAMGMGIIAFLMTHIGTYASNTKLSMFVMAAIILDFGVSLNLVISQRMIFSLGQELRGRLNGVFMATFFIGGALGSALGAWTYVRGGWSLASTLGLALPIIAMVYMSTDKTMRTNAER